MCDVIRKFEDLTDDEDGVPGVDAAALVGRCIKHRFTENEGQQETWYEGSVLSYISATHVTLNRLMHT